VLRIRDVYPGSLFLSLPDLGSNNGNKRGGGKKLLAYGTFFVAINLSKLKIIAFIFLPGTEKI
jgi:hypothetical protein